MRHVWTMRRLVIGALASVVVTTAGALAQPGPPGPGWGPGMMMGPGMMGPSGFGFLCHPRMAGFAEWRLAEIEEAVKPTDTQKAALDNLKAASAKAAELITTECPATIPVKPTERLDLAEKHLQSMVEAIHIVRPAFQTFYDSLDDKQKAKLDAVGPRHWGWRGWHWPWATD